MSTRIQISFVNPPKPGKTNGSIKTKTNEMYGVKPDMLGLFSPGGFYDIEFSSRDFNGNKYHTVTSVKKVEDAPSGPGSVGTNSKYGATDDKTVERIFVCGALNAAIQGGHVEMSAAYIGNLVNMLREVWGETFGAPPKKLDDMNDEIPF